MLKFTASILCSIVLCTAFGQDQLNYSKVKLDLSKTSIHEVARLGLETDHGHQALEKYIINYFSQSELQQLREAGISYDVLIEDVKAHYAKYGTTDEVSIQERNGDNCSPANQELYDYITPDNYESGSMGGYLTYSEALNNMDKMQELYPHLISPRKAIGDLKTQEQRSLYYLVISNSPQDIDESKPQVLYTSLHHAREPNSLSQLLFYMWYLLENYGTNEEVTYLVDHTTMFFLPIVNPDGYVYNETTDPNGGGLWRKNRHVDEEGDTVGVDLNRNYGYFWGIDDEGSSSNKSSETYRGPSPFSEPETQAVRQLCIENNFEIALNYHTFGNLLIHPWGYSDIVTEEDVLFKSFARMMTIENNYLFGTGTETVGYVANGDSDDWFYGEEDEKNKIYTMTPEVGPTFWPALDEIDQLNKSSLRHNLNTAHLLLNFAWAKELSPEDIISDNTGSLTFQLEKSGLNSDPISLSILSESPDVVLSNNTHPNLVLDLGETQIFEVNYEVDNSYADTIITLSIQIDNGINIHSTRLTKKYMPSDRINIYSNPIENEEDFMASGEWGLTAEKYNTPPYSYTDSPNKEYENLSQNEVILLEPMNTEDVSEAYLTYYTTFDLEKRYDFVQIQVSKDNSPYEALCGLYTVPASQFVDGRPIYEGQQGWVKESICLNPYLSAEELRFKFTFFSDGGVTRDGFYFDDLKYQIISENVVSTRDVTPTLLSVNPNPTDDQIHINMSSYSEDQDLSYELYSPIGSQHIFGQIVSNRQSVDVRTIPPGLYMLIIKKKGQLIHSIKIVKN